MQHPGPTTPAFLVGPGRLWMWLFGWRIEGEVPTVTKGVVIAAPHTSNWDLPHMLAASWVFRLKVNWFGKHTLFRPPLGWLLQRLGGLPVDRRAPRGLVGEVAARLEIADRLLVAVSPEGTRSRRDHWKSGFYWIAHEARVPVVCGYLDYERKRAGLGLTFVPSGDVRADMDRVRAFYASFRGRHPALESVIRLKEEEADPPAASARTDPR
jgi:1-acyl-sn-glycerol-3-phosphate acyltransferase